MERHTLTDFSGHRTKQNSQRTDFAEVPIVQGKSPPSNFCQPLSRDERELGFSVLLSVPLPAAEESRKGGEKNDRGKNVRKTHSNPVHSY